MSGARPIRVTSESSRSGLATRRARQAAEKRERLSELDRYRAYATTEVRDGRIYKVVRIPDLYDFKPLRVERSP